MPNPKPRHRERGLGLHFDTPVDRSGEVAGDAGYVSGLVVRPAVSGRRIGNILLDWAGSRSKQRGKHFLRLDYWADNPRLKIGCYQVRVEGDEIQIELPVSPSGAKP